MRAGKLRNKLAIYPVNENRNSYGEMVQSDSNPFHVWGGIKPASAGHSLVAQQHTEKTTHEITVRYDKRINAKMTIGFKDRKFEIENVVNYMERNISLILICKEFS